MELSQQSGLIKLLSDSSATKILKHTAELKAVYETWIFPADTDSLKTAVRVETEKVAGNTRRLYAGVTIQCPVRFVWQALTDYDSLAKFIPGMSECSPKDMSSTMTLVFISGNSSSPDFLRLQSNRG